MSDFHDLEAEGIRVTLDLAAGHVRSLVVTDGGRHLAPFHTAPWVDDPAVTRDATLPANLRHLSGDFFCAPFSTSDVEEAPPHGWPANSRWRHVDTTRLRDCVAARFRLDRTVLGATLDKLFTLRDRHPFLYQTHVFQGGRGALPVANHAMVALPAGGRLAFSAKRGVSTPATPLEPDPARGRSALLYPAETPDPTRVPLVDGTLADITRYPFAERHEDFAMLIEAAGSSLGWFAASRPATSDAVLSLKNPADYPVTLLWFSNGGRFYPPWNGRHIGVLGIEEARSHSLYGHRASVDPNPMADGGTSTALELRPDGTVAVRNVIGAVALPEDGAGIRAVEARDGSLLLTFDTGAQRTVPFDDGFLGS